MNGPSLQAVASSICEWAQAKLIALATRKKRLKRIFIERSSIVYVEI
jgi:hypothetical protein